MIVADLWPSQRCNENHINGRSQKQRFMSLGWREIRVTTTTVSPSSDHKTNKAPLADVTPTASHEGVREGLLSYPFQAEEEGVCEVIYPVLCWVVLFFFCPLSWSRIHGSDRLAIFKVATKHMYTFYQELKNKTPIHRLPW